MSPRAFAQVSVWEGKLSLPAYEEGPPDPNPPFDQYSSNTNYPYTMRDNLTDKRSDHEWRAVFLENEYLKCSILPDLGGHVYTCIDKLTNQPMFYANPSIKKAGIGYRGGWSAFGVEFNFPVSHNWVTASPVDYSFAKNADGSGSVFVGNVDRVYGMQWTVEIVLRPGSTVLQLKVTLNNRSDVRHRFYWWSNAGVQVWDDSRICYPMRYTASHGFTEIDTWPVNANGVDISVLKNQMNGPESHFVYGSREPFMGIWHPQTDTGIVHYSDADGIDWRRALSDNNSAYMEVQGGLFRNQETYAFIQPRQSIHFSEYWMPARGLGGIARANLNAVANLSRSNDSLHVAFNVNRALPGATVRILNGSTVVLDQKLDLAPQTTWKHEIALTGSEAKYTLEILDGGGALQLHQTEGEYDWTPKEQVKVGPQEQYKTPAPAERTEDDWVQFGTDEELNGARLAALVHYKQALERFPASLALRKAAGRLAGDLLRYDEAVEYLEPVERRETWNAETAYYLGIAYDGLGRQREAQVSFDAAGLLPEFHAAASLRLAELKARHGQLVAARNDLAESIRVAPDDLRSAEELMAVDNALGMKEAATALGNEWLARYPTSYFLHEELGTPDNAHLAADVDRILNIAGEYMRLGLYQKALGVLSRDYPPVPADEREPAETTPSKHPLVAYYRGYCVQQLGRSPLEDYSRAAALSTKYVFPSGAMTYAVLKSALKANPADAKATYLLGTLEFSVGMTDAGLENWNRALEMDPRIPSLGVDIGRALLELKGDATGGLPAFEREVTSGDASNPGGYYGVDQALSLLNRPASERVSALRRYPDAENMPTNMVYELALALSESGDHASAEKLFYHRHFMRAEGGTNVRQIWIEVRLQHALAMAREGQCQSALSIGSQLGSAVPDLDFTRDGLEPILRNARVQYLLGKLASDCGNAEQARSHFEQAAGDTSPIGAAWASMAAKRLGNYDDRKWRSLLEASRAAEDRRENSLGAYAAAMSERELGDEAAAETGFHKALLLPDGQMAYHLARLAIADEKK
jgi:hypothetical protein